MRLTDFCHLNDLRAPVPRAFPARSTTSRFHATSWGPAESLGLSALDRGTECFTALVNALADRS
jgi:hypothetical protein